MLRAYPFCIVIDGTITKEGLDRFRELSLGAARMSKSVECREYSISSAPSQLSGKNEWRSRIEISSEREGIVAAEPYTDDAIHATEEAADAHGIQLGQDIIDGKAPELSEE
jgi:hypothetical protein